MPFLALAGPALGAMGLLGGAGGVVGATSAMAGLVGAGAGAVGSFIESNQARQAAKGAAGQAAASTQIDIDALNQKITELSKSNAMASAELEKQLTPEVPGLRTAANQGIMGGINDPSLNLQNSYLMNMMGGQAPQAQSPLLQAAIAKAQADLGLGSSLSPELQNLVTRKGLATAGTVAPGTLGLGRDIVARDLGLTGLQVEQQRLQNASQLGSAELGANQFNVGTDLNNRNQQLAIIQLLQAITGQKFSQNLAAGQYAQSIRQPIVGLDPGSAGNIAMGNANNMGAAYTSQANISGAQSQGMTNLGGQLIGAGLLSYNDWLAQQRKKVTTPAVTPAKFTYTGGSLLNS